METTSDQTNNENDQTAAFSRGEGYITFVGYLQIVAGLMSVLLSGMAILLTTLATDASWLYPIAMVPSFDPAEPGFSVKLIRSYIALQLAFGWVFGLLMVVAGTLCLKRKGRGFVSSSAIINLLNFPHGTTVAILVLHGIARPRIPGAFQNE